MPIVVLIDSETASAPRCWRGQPGRPARHQAAGADGATTSSIQCIIPMDKAAPLDGLAGIRLTVAKLFSPASRTPAAASRRTSSTPSRGGL
ncbi:MAG: hypothetical protein U0797_23455 [Gemmataceae bacterium]